MTPDDLEFNIEQPDYAMHNLGLYADLTRTHLGQIADENLELHNIFMQGQVDHIGLSVGWGANGRLDFGKYIQIRDWFCAQGRGRLIDESIIPMERTGRPISIVKLVNPITSRFGVTIPFVEVAAPKLDQENSPSLINHIEIVLPNPMQLSTFIDLHGDYLMSVGAVTNEEIKKARNSIKHESVNPDLKIITPNRTVAKIHELSIEEVVRLQNNGDRALERGFNARFNEVITPQFLN